MTKKKPEVFEALPAIKKGQQLDFARQAAIIHLNLKSKV